MKREKMKLAIVDELAIRDKIYEIREMRVMLDFDLAEIYGYTTKAFNQQVKNNLAKFDEDFRFQITRDELDNLVRSKKLTSRVDGLFQGQFGGTRYLPWCFTESGIYMLMTVLKGELATQQSKALIRTFRAMKDYVIENQGMIGQREYLQLSLQVSDSMRDSLKMKADLDHLSDEMKNILDKLSDVVTKSEIAPILLELGQPEVKREYLFFNGEPAKAAETCINIYSQAKKSVYLVDDYVSIKTLRLLQGVKNGVMVVVFSDNKGNYLHASDYADFQMEFPETSVCFLTTNDLVHDRFIVLDFDTKDERIFHCGASSKDAGNKMTSIVEYRDEVIKTAFHWAVAKMMTNPGLKLR